MIYNIDKEGNHAEEESPCVKTSHKTNNREKKQKRLTANNVEEQEVFAGVRPEHVRLTDSGFRGTVDVSELMGSSIHLHLTDQNGKDMVVIINDKQDFASFSPGTEVNMTFGPDDVHVFDMQTEKNLEW